MNQIFNKFLVVSAVQGHECQKQQKTKITMFSYGFWFKITQNKKNYPYEEPTTQEYASKWICYLIGCFMYMCFLKHGMRCLQYTPRVRLFGGVLHPVQGCCLSGFTARPTLQMWV